MARLERWAEAGVGRVLQGKVGGRVALEMNLIPRMVRVVAVVVLTPPTAARVGQVGYMVAVVVAPALLMPKVVGQVGPASSSLPTRPWAASRRSGHFWLGRE